MKRVRPTKQPQVRSQFTANYTKPTTLPGVELEAVVARTNDKPRGKVRKGITEAGGSAN